MGLLWVLTNALISEDVIWNPSLKLRNTLYFAVAGRVICDD